MVVGIPCETYPGERRVAVVPGNVPSLRDAGMEVVVEKGAGIASGYTDKAYADKGAELVESRADVFGKADVVLQVRALGSNKENGRADLELLKEGQVVIGMMDPLGSPEEAQTLAQTKVVGFSMELIPRITRAQSMDVLSSQATIAGYRAVLLAADAVPKMFPMMMTAAGTISPVRAFIVGAGVAGLQAIATARRLGAVVEAYDVRPVVKEQVQSLGATFVEIMPEAGEAEDKGGYAKEMDEEFYRKQREMMIKVVANNDIVITTAAIPGKKAPILVTAEMVRGMQPGSVVVDLAAETGGNCELTQPGETIIEGGVTIIGRRNLPSDFPYHASQMYGKNITTFLLNLVKEGEAQLDADDQIIRETMVTRNGEVVNERVKSLLPGQEPEPEGEKSESGEDQGAESSEAAASESDGGEASEPSES